MTWLLERAVGVQDVVALAPGRAGPRGGPGRADPGRDAPVLGRRPDEVALPTGSAVVAVVRGDQVLTGASAGPFEPADEVLALTTLQAEPDLRASSAVSSAAPTPPPADPACGTLPPRNGM
jgi:hypothetical protein